MRYFILVFTVLFISACGVLPVANYDRDAMLSEAKLKRVDIHSYSINDVRALSQAWGKKIEEASISRRNQQLFADEILYYGTLLFAGAQSAIASKAGGDLPSHLIRLRNIGAGMVTGSTLFGEHYKVRDQQPIFERAGSRMRCANDALAEIVDYHILWTTAEFMAVVDDSGKPLVTQYDSIPLRAIEYIERRSLPDLRAALQAVSLGMPTKAEVQKVFEDAKGSSEKGAVALGKNAALLSAPTSTNKSLIRSNSIALELRTNSSMDLTDPEIEDKKRKFIAAVIAYSSVLATCTVSYPQ